MGKKERQELFLKHFRESHGIVSYACQKVGITRACYYKWRDSDLKFKERAEEVEEETIDVVESKLLSAINNDDLTAIIFYLKTRVRNVVMLSVSSRMSMSIHSKV